MTMYGAGSWNSPIFISDDEDEATVELELERRLASPRGDVEYQDDWDYYDDAVDRRLWEDYGGRYDDAPEDEVAYGYGVPVRLGEKRKRDVDTALFSSVAPFRTAQFNAGSPGMTPTESKNARKKRRRKEKERKEAEVHVQGTVAGPMLFPATSSTQLLFPGHPLPLSSTGNVLPRGAHMPSLPHPLPSKPVTAPSQHASFSQAPATPRQTASTSAFMAESMSASVSVSYASSSTSTSLLHTTFPAPEPTEVVSHSPQLVVKKPIGKPEEDDLERKHGAYTAPPGTRLPSTKRILVMDSLPKKFRNHQFATSWAAAFCHYPQTPRVYMNGKAGRALIIFPTEAVARAAWESPRLFGKGREHVRVWWYTGPEATTTDTDAKTGTQIDKAQTVPVPRLPERVRNVELEEGEIEEDDDSTALPPKAKQKGAKGESKQKARQKQPVSSTNLTRRLDPSLPSLPLPPSKQERTATSISISVSASTSTPSVQRLAPLSARAAAPPTRRPPVSVLSVPPLPPWDEVVDMAEGASPMDLDSDDGIVDSLLAAGDTASDSSVPAHGSLKLLASTGGTKGLQNPLPQVVSRPLVPLASLPHVPLSGANLVPLPVRAPAPVENATPAHIAPLLNQGSLPPASLASSSATQSAPLLASSYQKDPAPSLVPSRSTAPPFEPHSVNNATPGPSNTKLSLMARQKELEEKIARTKEQLAARTASKSGSATPTALATTTASSADKSSTSLLENTDMKPPNADSGHVAGLTAATTKPLVSNSAPQEHPGNHTSTQPTYTAHTHTGTISGLVKVSTTAGNISLDDLAVSFITESIHSVSLPKIVAASTPVTPSPTPMSEKAILAAKQQTLERHIAQSKVLMAKLGAASSKPAKDAIMREMKESTRRMEEEMKSFSLPVERGSSQQSAPPSVRPRLRRWPETTSCVLVISDDESDGED